jgi:hypothetical protein
MMMVKHTTFATFGPISKSAPSSGSTHQLIWISSITLIETEASFTKGKGQDKEGVQAERSVVYS